MMIFGSLKCPSTCGREDHKLTTDLSGAGLSGAGLSGAVRRSGCTPSTARGRPYCGSPLSGLSGVERSSASVNPSEATEGAIIGPDWVSGVGLSAAGRSRAGLSGAGLSGVVSGMVSAGFSAPILSRPKKLTFRATLLPPMTELFGTYFSSGIQYRLRERWLDPFNGD